MYEEEIRKYIREKRTVRGVTDIPGGRVFVKTGDEKSLACEAEGLDEIRKAGFPHVPEIYFAGQEGGRYFLVTEYIEGDRRPRYEEFGRNLACMHMVEAEYFGFSHDNYIGLGIQVNTVMDSWIDFFRECRLRVQFERASGYFDHEYRGKMNILLTELDDLLTEPDHPSLIHGDLWGGNHVTGPGGHIYLIDPAVYAGHAEADLAMTEMFGRFPDEFYRAYHEVVPEDPGYTKRRDIYNLYHLLNHLNIFGSGYLGSVRAVIDRYVGRRIWTKE